MYTIYSGVIGVGFQIASVDAVGREFSPSPYRDSALKLQAPYFASMEVDLEAIVPGMRWSTLNLELGVKLRLKSADWKADNVPWTENEPGGSSQLPPETFSFVRCCLAFESSFYTGLIYYPHPETKPHTNRHHFDVLEVLSQDIPGARPWSRADVICRADAFDAF